MDYIITENAKRTGSQILELSSDVKLELGKAGVMTPEGIDEAYNGTGPERWSESVREKIDEFTSFYAPAVVVHDCDFHLSDGTEEGLKEATKRFRHNTKVILRTYYPLLCLDWFIDEEYRKKRAKLVALKVALDIGVSEKLCRKAWTEAFERSKGN